MAGFTLAEATLVTAILAVAAGVALPSAAPLAEVRLDAAASEVVAALRFARDDAMRTGQYRMVSCSPDANRIRVFRLEVYSTFTYESFNTLNHPVTGQPYTVFVGAATPGGPVSLNRCTFTFPDGMASAVTFDPNGNPVRGTGDTASQAQALASGTVVVSAGRVSRAVNVEPTGRVTAS